MTKVKKAEKPQSKRTKLAKLNKPGVPNLKKTDETERSKPKYVCPDKSFEFRVMFGSKVVVYVNYKASLLRGLPAIMNRPHKEMTDDKSLSRQISDGDLRFVTSKNKMNKKKNKMEICYAGLIKVIMCLRAYFKGPNVPAKTRELLDILLPKIWYLS